MSIIQSSGVSTIQGLLKYSSERPMEGQLGLGELSVILWVSAFQGCPLRGVPLYLCTKSLLCVLSSLPCLVLILRASIKQVKACLAIHDR